MNEICIHARREMNKDHVKTHVGQILETRVMVPLL